MTLLSLTTDEQELGRRMTQGKEKEEWGFELLLERRRLDLAKFFDPLAEAGLFAPENSSGPVPSDREGLVHIPYWPALKYLEVLAKQSGEKNDLETAEKVMNVVRAVTNFREPDGGLRDNYHTFGVFAEILGALPPAAVTQDDIDLISVWLGSRYDNGHVASILDKGFMRRALSSSVPEEWNKACKVLYRCTAVEWVVERGFQDEEEEERKPISLVEGYWLERIIKNNTEALGRKIGKQASEVFVKRLRQVFGQKRGEPSHWSRSTIEDSDQNRPLKEAGDHLVEGLRDILRHWIAHDADTAREYIRVMLDDTVDVIRRIAIHAINHHWIVLQDLYFSTLSPELFCDAHLHELYQLLSSHFSGFSEQQKVQTLDAIRNVPQKESEDMERLRKRTQRNWLSAIVGQGYAPADRWYRELDTDPNIGSLFTHPSLHSYHESWSGPGPSPYSMQEILKHAQDGTLIEALHAFKEPDGWQGPETPTTRALVDVLCGTAKQYPEVFIRILPAFLNAKRPFQYGVVKGFKQLWDDAKKDNQQQIDWEKTWCVLVEFLTNMLNDSTFWEEEVIEDQDMTPNRDWIPPLVAELLEEGTKSDAHAYPESLLPNTWQLINLLLEKVESEGDIGEDPMFAAINSGRGKVIEAFFNHALRACRVSHQASDQHSEVWEKMRPVFDQELSKCKGGNYEMSTLSGAYIGNLDYLSRDWLASNIGRIFPGGYPENFVCAIDGMAYAPEHRPVYQLLIKSGILDKALKLNLRGRHSRAKLIQRIALAYLLGDEELDGPRFEFLFESKALGDLEEAGDFLWSVSNQKLNENQISRILAFWSRCIDWSKSLDEVPAAFLSSLSKLACYVMEIGESQKEKLLEIAPYVHIGYDADRFIEELDRLADAYPKETCEILGKVLETYRPVFDYEDHLKQLIMKIAVYGASEKQDALKYVDQLAKLRLRGMYELFKELQDT